MTSRSRSDWASCPAASTSPSRLHSASLWQAISTRSSGRGAVQFVAHLADVAAEALDRLDAQMAGRFHRAGWAGPRA